MQIKWLGHSCFEIINNRGITIVTDPFDSSVGYKVPDVEADIVTTSHGHFDHNYTKALKGDFDLINKIGHFYVKDIVIRGIPSHHDDSDGRKRGPNIIFSFEIDNIKICHLGDLGHTLNDKQLESIGGVNVLMIPVGGYYTIGAAEAEKVVSQLKPNIVIPMHYKTPVIDFPIATADEFMQNMKNVEKLDSTTIEVSDDLLNVFSKVFILKYEQ